MRRASAGSPTTVLRRSTSLVALRHGPKVVAQIQSVVEGGAVVGYYDPLAWVASCTTSGLAHPVDDQVPVVQVRSHDLERFQAGLAEATVASDVAPVTCAMAVRGTAELADDA